MALKSGGPSLQRQLVPPVANGDARTSPGELREGRIGLGRQVRTADHGDPLAVEVHERSSDQISRHHQVVIQQKDEGSCGSMDGDVALQRRQRSLDEKELGRVTGQIERRHLRLDARQIVSRDDSG